MDINQEILLLAIGLVLFFIWIILDKIAYKRLGMSPIFGSLKQEKYEDKIRVFAIGVSWQLILLNGLALLAFKIIGIMEKEFSFKIWGGSVLVLAIVGNLISRLVLNKQLEKPEKDKFNSL